MTESAETTAGTEATSETCNSSLGTPISALAHKRVRKKTGTRIHRRIMPRDALPPSSLYTPPLRPSPASSLHTPPLRPPRRHSCTRRRYVHPRRHSCEGRNLNANFFLLGSYHCCQLRGNTIKTYLIREG